MTDSFSSSDDIRSGGELAHLQLVELPGVMALERGGELPGVVVGYETYGELNEARDNAVLICHAISGDSHVARHDGDDLPGWWDELVGPGDKFAIDTERYFVICTNVLGGCSGTTGPRTVNPQTGRRYGAEFPVITIGDMVETQRRALDELGIGKLRAVVGGSLGGHQALTWATRHPDRVENCIAIATSPRLTSQALGFDVVARNAIQTDPHFAGGQYYDEPEQPATGLAIARMLGHITYLSTEAMDAKFDPDRHSPRDIATAFEKKFSVGAYLAHQGQKFVERFDANSYVTISLAMDLFDLGRTRRELLSTLRSSRCRFLVVSFSSDWLFTPAQSREIVNALAALDRSVTYCEITTTAGHDAFLLVDEIGQFGPLVAARLDAALETNAAPAELRANDRRILDLIEPGKSVLDLGCGSGRVLSELRRRGHDKLMGVEVAQEKIIIAASRGLDVIDYDLNHGLPAFDDHQFDLVVMSATLQAIEHVETLLDETLRVGRQVILSFPNFAHQELREMFVREGRSPKASNRSSCGSSYGYEWYNTPNRRFPSIADVEDFCRAKGVTIHRAIYLDTGDTEYGREITDDPNLNADTAILVISRES